MIDANGIMPGAGKVVVIALGNRFRGDDGIGPVVAERLKGRIDGCSFVEQQDDAMAIVCEWEGAALAVVIDAAVSGAAPGTIHRSDVESGPLPKDLARCSSHGLGLAEAVELGKVLGRFPDKLVIYAIEGATFELGTGLSREVSMVAEDAARAIETEIASLVGM